MTTELQPKFETVMIIDDSRLNLLVGSFMITENNFGKKVLEYSVASEALKYLQNNKDNFSALPEVIFVDLYMPIMSGFEFMEEYDKLSPALKNHCAVYIISSSTDNEDIVRSHNDKNVVSFQVKPITMEFLDSILGKLIPIDGV